MKQRFVRARCLTDRACGHTLNRRQVLSPDRQWAVFDTRNDDAAIGQTRSIERVHLASGQIETLYHLEEATEFGPGVGAAAYHPFDETVIFIHGLWNCNAKRPYGMSRRFGAVINANQPSQMSPAESRIVEVTPPPGVLSGGTHAHSWSPSGKRISFTYNDARRPDMPRTVGFLTNIPHVQQQCNDWFEESSGKHEIDSQESFQGSMSGFLLLLPGIDSPVQQAVEECWIDENRIAFLGLVPEREGSDKMIQEVFLATLPTDQYIASSCEQIGCKTQLVCPDVHIRQLTNSAGRKFPGISAPRHWLVASHDGRGIYCLIQDELGIVQLTRVSVDGGYMEQLTQLNCSIEGQIALSPDGERVSFVSDSQIYVYNVQNQEIERWVETEWEDAQGHSISRPTFVGSYLGAAHFVDESTVLVNRFVKRGEDTYLQVLSVSG